MSTGSGTITPITPAVDPSVIEFAGTVQMYCTVADLLPSNIQGGGNEVMQMRAIRAASDFLAKEIGWFIPVTETRLLDGNGTPILIVPPFTALTSISHDGTALSASDYHLHPTAKEWANGPYSWIELDDDGSLVRWSDKANVVSMTAHWGMYEATADTETNLIATKQALADTILAVLDGSKISPGMIVKLDNEQELVISTGSPTSSVTTVAAAVGATDEEITLTNEALVNIGEVIRLDFEKLKILDINTTTHKASVMRQYQGTKQAAHTISTIVSVYRTFNVTRNVNSTTAAEHALSSDVYRYLVPNDLGWLAREIATLMTQKELGNFAGRTGNAELGTVFYNDAFPRDDLARIKAAYTIRGQ
jgi:hypothetical protein